MVTKLNEVKANPEELIVIDEEYFRWSHATGLGNDGDDDPDGGLSLEDSYIIAFTGRRGSGKTTLMTFLAVWAVIFENKHLLSNYPIEFNVRRYRPDGKTYLQHVKSEDLDFTKLITFNPEYKSVLILLDEAADVVSHLASQSWKNRLLAAFVRQIRKNDISLVLATQDFMMIDKQLRWQVDIEVKCADYSRYGGQPGLLRGSVLDEDMYDHSGVWTNQTTEDRIWRGEDPRVCQYMVRPCFLWGDKEKNIKPAFDSWYQINILENLRKYDLQQSKIEIGDRANITFEARFPVSASALARALEAIRSVRQEFPDNPAIYQPDFYQVCAPLVYSDKNNLGKTLTEYGVYRGKDSRNRFYGFTDEFRLADFEAYVRSRQSEEASAIE